MWTENVSKTELYENDGVMIVCDFCDFPDRLFLKHKSKMTGDRCVFKFLRCVVGGGGGGEHLMRFQSETRLTVFKFLPRNVNGNKRTVHAYTTQLEAPNNLQ